MRASGAGGTGQGQAIRPIDIVIFCVTGALLLVVFMVYSNTSTARRGVVRLRRDLKGLTKQVDKLRDDVAQMDGERSLGRAADEKVSRLKKRLASLESRPVPAAEVSEKALAAAVDAALERRREAFTADMNRRGEQIAAEIAKRVDLAGVGGNLRKTADNFRAGQLASGSARARLKAGLEEGKERKRTPGAKKTDEAVARGLDAAAEGIDLFRKMQAGEITREEFREKTRGLRDRMRKQFENLTPEEREALRGRWGGWGRRRNRDGGGVGGGGGGEPKKF